MSIDASGSMDCDGHIVVVVVNNTTAEFHGMSSTPSSWIEAVDLAPGATQRLAATVSLQVTRESGFVLGNSIEGKVSTPWVAARPGECGAVPTVVPRPVDTTPRPIPTSAPGDVQLCVQPGSSPPQAVPCDSPLATTPATLYTPPTSAAVDQPVDGVVTTPEATIDTATPATHKAVVHVQAKAVQAAHLPDTGPGDITPAAGLSGLLALVVGVILVTVRRRGVSKETG